MFWARDGERCPGKEIVCSELKGNVSTVNVVQLRPEVRARDDGPGGEVREERPGGGELETPPEPGSVLQSHQRPGSQRRLLQPPERDGPGRQRVWGGGDADW